MHEDKKQRFLQAGSIVFTGQSRTCTKYPKYHVYNIFAISRNEGRAEVDFLHVDKHQTVLQIDRINLGGYDQACPQIIQNCNFVNSLEYLKKEAKDEVDFVCRWAAKLSINRYYHFWWVWPGMPKVLKNYFSLQYLKKELNYEVDILHADKDGSLLQVDNFNFDKGCPNYLGKFAISL